MSIGMQHLGCIIFGLLASGMYWFCSLFRFRTMLSFSHLRALGSHFLDLSEDEQLDDGIEDQVDDVVRILDEPLIVDEDISEAETVPGCPAMFEEDTIPVIEIVETDSEVEVLEVSPVSQILTMQQEIEGMRAQERFGYLFRVQEQAAGVEGRLSRVFSSIAQESVEDRRARRANFRVQVHGRAVFE